MQLKATTSGRTSAGRKALVLLAVWALAAHPAFAAFNDIGEGARAPGMGNAFVAVADDVDAIYYNPAGLASLYGPQFTSSYSSLFGGLSDGSTIGQSWLAYAQPLKHGDWGTLGVGWSQLSVSGLYAEQTTYLSYGRVLMQQLGSGSLSGGITFKELKQSFTVPGNGNGTSLANNSVNNYGFFSGVPDPLLSNTSVSATGADVGFLYNFQRHYAVGLQIVDILSPKLGGDSIPMGAKIGFAYRALLTNITLELQHEAGSNGQVGNTFALGGERWLPTNSYGDFGLRAGFGVGDQEFEQFTLGASYRFSKLQLDYSFVIPFNSVTGTSGNQRFALSFLFGKKELAEETPGEVAARQLKGLGAEESGESAQDKIQAKKDKDRAKKLYASAQQSVQDGEFQKAADSMSEAIKLDPSIPGIGEYFRRLAFVSDSVPDLTDQTTKAHTFIYNGIIDLLAQRDSESVRKIAYGVSLNSSDTQMSDFLVKLEKFTGIQAEHGQGNLSLVDQKLTQSLMAFKSGDYDKVIALCGEVLALEPNNVDALNRLGSALYVTKDYPKAMEEWQKAYDLSTDENTKHLLQKYINMAQQKANQNGQLQPGTTDQQQAPQPSTAPAQGGSQQQGAGSQ